MREGLSDRGGLHLAGRCIVHFDEGSRIFRGDPLLALPSGSWRATHHGTVLGFGRVASSAPSRKPIFPSSGMRENAV